MRDVIKLSVTDELYRIQKHLTSTYGNFDYDLNLNEKILFSMPENIISVDGFSSTGKAHCK